MTLPDRTTTTFGDGVESTDSMRLRHLRILEVVAQHNDAPQRRGAMFCQGCLPVALSEIVPAETRIEIEHIEGAYLGLRRLREETFDLVLFHHVPGEQDAAEFLRALHGAGVAEPVVIVTPVACESLERKLFALGGDTWPSEGATAGALARLAWRAIQRGELVRQANRLALHRKRWIQRERGEAVQHRQSQQLILRALGHRGDDRRESESFPDVLEPLPAELQDEYRQLLRMYVMMGSGNLSGEVWQWAQLLIGGRVRVRRFLELHLGCVDHLLDALGNRGSRHCVRRADLLLVEALAHLVEYHESPDAGSAAPDRNNGTADSDTAPVSVGSG